MFLRKQKEFQYHPAIITMLEDVVGGGTVNRTNVRTAIFDGKALDELPPFCVVGKASTGAYEVLKTAKVVEAVTETGTTIKVAKNHLFAVGDFVTAGGACTGAADKITAIDKSNDTYDVLTLAATIAAITKGAVLVAAKEKAAAGSAGLAVTSELVITMAKVDLTVANQSCGLLRRGTISEANMPFSLDASLKKLMLHIIFD
ncbi:MAG: hypothetical protein ACRCUJ_06495 [Phocaeicola sp.]